MQGDGTREAGEGRLAGTFAALRHRNYRLWFLGQLVSLLGSWMQITAQGYLVYQLTHSPGYLGLVAFASGVPSWALMLVGGVAADRFPRRRLIALANLGLMTLSAALAALTFTGAVQPWHVVGLSLLGGVANAFDAPARQAFVLELVGRARLTNAIALNSFMFNLATAVGPAAAGATYTLVGPGWCFAINALSFVGVLVALALMRLEPRPPAPARDSALAELREGLGFARSHPDVRRVLVLVAGLSVFGFSFVTLVPAWAVQVLGGDATTTGLLQSARGVGALAGALAVATFARPDVLRTTLRLTSVLFPLALLAFAAMRSQALALATMIAVGASMMVTLNLCNALLQTLVPDALRGRVMAIYGLALFGGMPLGGLLAGALAEQLGEPSAVALGAGVTLLFALAARARDEVRGRSCADGRAA